MKPILSEKRLLLSPDKFVFWNKNITFALPISINNKIINNETYISTLTAKKTQQTRISWAHVHSQRTPYIGSTSASWTQETFRIVRGTLVAFEIRFKKRYRLTQVGLFFIIKNGLHGATKDTIWPLMNLFATWSNLRPALQSVTDMTYHFFNRNFHIAGTSYHSAGSAHDDGEELRGWVWASRSEIIVCKSIERASPKCTSLVVYILRESSTITSP